MHLLPLTAATAPDASKPILEGAARAFGFVPNLLGNMAHAPALLQAYTAVSAAFDTTSLTAAERQVVLLATSVRNQCTYCVAAHTVIAGMQQVPGDVVEALRRSQPLADPRLQALRQFVEEIVESRGWPSVATETAFFEAGYTQAQALEVLVGVGQKTLSNYMNHIAGTPLDNAFADAAWSREATPAD
ncbi:MAG: carboxymuconolactone decarboxylase family protein [Vicinamibacterales bacterium]|nr:carboxymuconolactone decarboxylase family protein [Vicinamibacterales bacterium]